MNGVDLLFIGFIVGLITGIVIFYFTDTARLRHFSDRGYDRAVADIMKYGYYYDKRNRRRYVTVSRDD